MIPKQKKTTEIVSREALATRTFVQLADTLVVDFDLIDLLTILADRSVELLDAAAAGILLGDRFGRLRVMAASNEEVELLELFQIQSAEGRGTSVTVRLPLFSGAGQTEARARAPLALKSS